MPVRKIPRSHRNVTGRIAVPGARTVAFESPLERDFVLTSQFTPGFAGIEEQPVRIHLPAGRHYTPDFLVTWDAPRCPDLVEVKPSKDVETFMEKWDPAARFAAERGWRFRIMTEKEIRTPRLANARFLLPFRPRFPDPVVAARILSILNDYGPVVSLENVIAVAITTQVGRGHLLPVLWHLISSFRIAVDLDMPLTMASLASPVDGDHR